MGGLGESAAGGSFLSGMGAGVESAAGSLSGAWSATMAGDVSGAAGYIGNAWGSAGTAGELASAANAAAMGPSASLMSTGSSVLPAVNPGVGALGPGASQVAAVTPGTGLTAGASNTSGLISNGMSAAGPTSTLGSTVSPYALVQPGAASTLASTLPATAAPAGWWAGVDPYLKTAAVMGGTQVVGGLVSGAGQAKAAQEARDEVERIKLENLARGDVNVGTILDYSPFARPATPQYYQRPVLPQPKYYPQPTAVAQAPTGMVARYMPGATG